MRAASQLLVRTGVVWVLDPYSLYVGEAPEDWAGVYEVGDPGWYRFRMGDIVRWKGAGKHRRTLDHPSVFSVDGGSIALFDAGFYADLKAVFDPNGSTSHLIDAANARIGVPGAIAWVRGSTKGRGAFVGDGEYWFRDGAFRPKPP